MPTTFLNLQNVHFCHSGAGEGQEGGDGLWGFFWLLFLMKFINLYQVLLLSCRTGNCQMTQDMLSVVFAYSC